MENLIAVSSWSLHRTIGLSYWDSPQKGPQGVERHSATVTPLAEIPSALREHGYSAMQLCHFHLPSRDSAYIAEFRSCLRESDVELLTLLIDEGDVTDPEFGEASIDWMASWVRTASELGAQRARLIAGKQPYSKEAMDLAVTRLKKVAETAAEHDVLLEIENWHQLLSTPAAVHELLDRCEGAVRLNADFGNWPKPLRYEGLPQIFGRAETCHAKFDFVSPTELDEEDAQKLLRIAIEADYKGPMVLVNGGIGDSDWDAMDIQRAAIQAA